MPDPRDAPRVIAVLGDVLVDVVVTPRTATAARSDTESHVTWRQGGAAANTASWLAAIHAPVRLIGRVGNDLAGRALQAMLTDLGVECRLAVDPDAPTGTVVAVVDAAGAGDRDMYTSRGASGQLADDDLDEGWLTGVSHLHLSGYTLLGQASRAAAVRALALAHRRGVSISVDPASHGPLAAIGVETFLSWLPDGVLLTPNRDEASLLTGHTDPTTAARHLATMAGEAVVTCGADGAVWSDGRRVAAVEAPRSTDGIDPVGAGDAFSAGLLAARAAGEDVEAQLHRAVAVAARAVAGGHPVTSR